MEWKSFTKTLAFIDYVKRRGDTQRERRIYQYIDCIIGLISLCTDFGCLSFLSLSLFFVHEFQFHLIEDIKSMSRALLHNSYHFAILLLSVNLFEFNLVTKFNFFTLFYVRTITCALVSLPSPSVFILACQSIIIINVYLNKYNLNVINSFEIWIISQNVKIFTETTSMDCVVCEFGFFLLKLQFTIVNNNMFRFSGAYPKTDVNIIAVWLRDLELCCVYTRALAHAYTISSQKENLI